MRYTRALKEEYIALFKSMEIHLNKLNKVDYHVDQIMLSKYRYETIEAATGVPWYFVALVHTLESNRKFSRHMHNGDSLSKRTTHVPSGRPQTGTPPFTWEESAIDAMNYKDLQTEKDWTLPRLLYSLENYNGWGYRLYHAHVKSPYLWSYSDIYSSGKYVSDGTFSNTAKSKQSGAAVILRRLEQRGVIPILDTGTIESTFFFHSNKIADRADDLQRFLNTFPGISLLVDSKPGNKTSAACKNIFGEYLIGDNRRS